MENSAFLFVDFVFYSYLLSSPSSRLKSEFFGFSCDSIMSDTHFSLYLFNFTACRILLWVILKCNILFVQKRILLYKDFLTLCVPSIKPPGVWERCYNCVLSSAFIFQDIETFYFLYFSLGSNIPKVARVKVQQTDWTRKPKML